MKKVKANLFLQLVAIPGFLISDFILARYYPEQVLQMYSLNWIFLFLVLLFCFFPLARRPLVNSSTKESRLKAWRWLALIIVFELSLMAAWSGLIQFLDLMQPGLNVRPSFLNTSWTIKQWGLIPWAGMICMGSLMAYYAYLKHKDASMCKLMFPLFRSSPTGTLGITANVCARLNAVLAMIGCFMIASLGLSYLGAQLLNVPLAAGLNIEDILSLSLILILMTHGKLGARLFETLLKRNGSAFGVLLFAIILMAVLMTLSSWMLGSVERHAVSLPQWLDRGVSLSALAHLLMMVWILSWTVLGGIFLAYISRGYTLIQLIGASLALPILLSLFGDYDHLFSSNWLIILGSLGSILLIFLFTSNPKMLMMLMQVYVPADEPKQRASGLFVVNWIRMGMGLSYLYLIGGALILGLVVVSYVLPSFIYFLMAAIASSFWFIQQKS